MLWVISLADASGYQGENQELPVTRATRVLFGGVIFTCLIVGFDRQIRAADSNVPVRFVQTWGSKGSKPGEFNFPIGIAVGPKDDVFVTDFYNDRVERFTAGGKLLAAFRVKPHPAGLAVDSKGQVYISHFNLNRSKDEEKQDRVTVYDSDGKFLREWGKTGNSDGEFEAPGGIAIAKNGEIYVTD